MAIAIAGGIVHGNLALLQPPLSPTAVAHPLRPRLSGLLAAPATDASVLARSFGALSLFPAMAAALALATGSSDRRERGQADGA